MKQGPRASSSAILLTSQSIYSAFRNYIISLNSFLFFMWIWISAWEYLLSAWRTSFSIFYKAGQLAMNSHSFCLSENAFISSSVLKYSFAWYRILGWQFFTLTTLNLLSHCLLDSTVSNEKSTVNDVPLFVMILFLKFFKCPFYSDL